MAEVTTGADKKISDSVFLSSQTVEWATEQAFFDQVNREFGFTVDVAADKNNAKCDRFYDIDSDGLMQDWDGETVWCNPPYGDRIKDWMYKAATSEATTVLLVPARTDVKWFHEIVLPRAEVRFIKGRLRFGGSKDPAPFPTMLVIFRGGKMGE
ncbi:adenine methyltransferase [Cryobacterium sp. Hh11]|uniref:DNA N-6-adenine-methyltransferase n=1 Tax=Cryobacterium sp. Hh11 TaxID=2555868 RepID=UPI001068F779|nr:DNA N-6-adenine-methyltransferase [Cryobacterium sp. Hh11]TFD51977.1 adenine methyltransferase [Cryobacterium sp. Hh11]